MKPEILALAEYLDVDVESILDEGNNIYEDEEGNCYYVFLDSDLLLYINEDLYKDQCDLVEEDLEDSTRFSEYRKYFIIDYDELHEHCITDLEEILGTKERVSIDIEGESYVILELL